MKKLYILLLFVFICKTSFTQNDSTKNITINDTIKIGGIIIIKKEASKNKTINDIDIIKIKKHTIAYQSNKNISTNWGIIDLGFSNYIDNTNYNNSGNYLITKPGSSSFDKNDFTLRTGKSININLWLFMQQLNLSKHHINLKYGMGVELNNYRFKTNISYKEKGILPYTNNTTNAPFIFRDSIAFSKNKLATDYFTVPFLLNFVSNPNNRKAGISLSVGVSAGYLYSQRNKQISSERGKDKNKGEYDLNRFKFSYIAELGLGPVRLYGTFSPISIYNKTLDIKPYSIGIRFSNW